MYVIYFFLLTKIFLIIFFFFSSRRRHTISYGDWSSDVCSSDLGDAEARVEHIALEVEDLLALIEQLKAKGVRFTTDEPVRVRENIVVWTVPATSAGVMWQLFSRARP